MSKWIKAYKGFSQDMKCRGFQFEEGKEYSLPEGEEAKLCKKGFHACEAPIDCLSYYEPAHSVYHEVELGATDEKENDSKRVGKRIKIGAKISIGSMVKAQFEYVKEHATNKGTGHTIDARSANSATGYGSANSATGARSANSATGYGSANSATGDWSANSATGARSANSATGYGSANSATGYGSANSATGDWSANSATGARSANSATGYGSANSATGARSANSATGYGSANSATGYGSANSATGDWSANSATGYGSANSATGARSANSATGARSANSATGDWSANSATGYGSANVTTGEDCSNKGTEGTINIGWGKNNKCKGEIGAYLVLCERGNWDGSKYPLIGEPRLAKVDGETVKADTWYMLKNGELIESPDGATE